MQAMQHVLLTRSQRIARALATATLQAWVWVLALAAMLWLLRLGQMAWHWPAGYTATAADLWAVLYQGARFDLKVCAAAALLLWPLWLLLPARWHGALAGTVAVLFVTANLVNLHYFGFYKTPIDPVVFGFFEDDTQAIVRTIWSDFPVLPTLGVLAVASWAVVAARRRAYDRLAQALDARIAQRRLPVWVVMPAVLLALLLLVLTTKGTLRAMALGRQNVTVTTSQFLNDMVPNGVIAFKFAWDGRKASQNFSDPLLGLRQLGYGTPLEAARALGLAVTDEAGLRAALVAPPQPVPAAGRKHLLFFLMESWSAEPFLYHDAREFDVLGRLEPTLGEACHFHNFDAAQPGTHPALEAILFSTPITPLTLGPQGRRPIPWAVPLLLKQAGYRTVFLTSARSGWRELDRVLKAQGFDEIIDASHLKAAYPEAELGIWGVWDEYLFRYLGERLQQPQPQPLFVFVLTATNHPPYDLPASYRRLARNEARWGGERNSADLWPNLDTWHYATDLLGALVQQVRSGPLRDRTLIAATGDHNVRSFGIYATPQRQYLKTQVPFILWGTGDACGPQRSQPASHRDMFPTLLPLLGVGGYLQTGRNLLDAPARQPWPAAQVPLAVNYYGGARSAQGSWQLGQPGTFVCTPPAAPGRERDCAFDARLDALARAQIGLLDWMVRSTLRTGH
jgi:phosphoglycerol transferase MdoB-like AlkP superfamily enzyme